MTAIEWIEDNFTEQRIDKKHVEWLILEFAKMKVKEALQVAAESAIIKVQKKSPFGKYRKWKNVKEDEVDLFNYIVQYSVDKDSILNAYNLNLIK
jgi:hypothetical protein